MAKPGFCDRPFFSFPGAAFTKMGQLVKGGGTAVGGRGVAKSRASCSRIRGRGFVQAPEGSSVTFLCVLYPTPHLKDVAHAPTATISMLPPQESKGIRPKPSAAVA